jgi:hypothetical protein
MRDLVDAVVLSLQFGSSCIQDTVLLAHMFDGCLVIADDPHLLITLVAPRAFVVFQLHYKLFVLSCYYS